jgi:hypothetical protein
VAVWSLADAGLQTTGGVLTATSLLTVVTASATANAVGAWVQMVASTPFPVSGLRVHLGKVGIAVAATNAQASLDIGVGLANFEVAVAQDIAIGGALPFASWDIPLSIPMGSRICVRLRSSVASKSTTMAMHLWGGGLGLEGGYKAVTLGAVTTGSRGTILTAPTSLNTKAAWTVLSAATTVPARFLLVALSSPNTTIATAADHLIDIGVGAAAAEAVIIANLACTVSVNEDISYPRPALFPVSIPVGSRVVARYQSTSTSTAATPSVTLTTVG